MPPGTHGEPRMSTELTFDVFFTDYIEHGSVSHDQPKPMTKTEIIRWMETILGHTDGNFLGLVDESGKTLQFMTNQDGSIHIDIPAVEERGSYTRTATLNSCLLIVRELGAQVRIEEIGGFDFQSW